MSEKEINISIAEACGWAHPSVKPYAFPDYCRDLNAMHEAEKTLDYEQLCDMQESIKFHHAVMPFHATARQRAEAFLRELGKMEGGRVMTDRYIFKFATKKAGCKGPDPYKGDVIWDESDGPKHLKFWSGKEYERLSDMVRNEVDKYMKLNNPIERPTPETALATYRVNGVDIVWPDFAERLERERDEAREAFNLAEDERVDMAKQLSSEKACHAQCQNERDEARDNTPWHSNGETKDEWFARQREKYAVLERERDEAWEENKKFREALEWIVERYENPMHTHQVAMDAYEMSCAARAALRMEEAK